MAEAETEESKRKKILEGARAIFFREGISSLTMDQIAARQGISKKTLYKYFTSKQDLVEAAVQEKIEEVGALVRSVAENHSLPFPRRMGMILGIVGRQLALLGDRLMNDMAYREPQLWERIDRFRREKVFGVISTLFDEGIRDGYVRSDVDARLIHLLFITSVTSILSPQQFFALTTPPVVVFQSITRILLGGILTDEGRAQLARSEPTMEVHE